jgi:hypothetical protein
MDFFKKIEAALNKIGKLYVSELKNRLLRDGNIASKELSRSITSKVVSDGVEITANRYLSAVSEGKKATNKGPSEVMVSRVASWMKHKGIRPRGNGKLTELKYKKAAFVIARSINRKGFEGSKVIARSFKAIEDNIDKEISSALKETVELLIEDINQDINNK